mmetsp:Transcript_25070/g.54157  ORF Transcript_25070/g.54157 Transcript_25070/m.54157 type:complete len:121 (-) Transcript_25070:230-592(-)
MLADFAGARSYTTRAKEEQRRTAASAFVGRVRRWEKRWVKQGHLLLLSWERTDHLTPPPPERSPFSRHPSEQPASLSPAEDEDGADKRSAGAIEEEPTSKRLRTEDEVDAAPASCLGASS